MMFGWKTNPHMGPFHLFSFAFIGGGFIVISAGWKVLFEAQRRHTLATGGIYAHVRHPQYVGFILVMFGFLLQWPTLLTLAMFPALVFMYVRLARTEEREALVEFGGAYQTCMAAVPGFSRASDHRAARPAPKFGLRADHCPSVGGNAWIT